MFKHAFRFVSIFRKPFRSPLKNQRGQGLVEYLVIVALMGVATIAIVRTMGAVVSSRFASVAKALQGDRGSEKVPVEESAYKKRDLGNFFDGVGDSNGGRKKSNEPSSE
jgi:pilus assembly protein Flp/PilA